MLRSLLNAAAMYGLDLRRMWHTARGLPTFLSNHRRFKSLAHGDRDFPIARLYPCLTDRYESSGVASGHYFHQDLLVAQWIHQRNPSRHVDVGGRVDGIVAHLASTRPVEVIDIRAQRTSASNIVFHQADIMNLDVRWHDYTDSLSCLHTIEHFGLGRYGDPLDPHGYARGWDALHAMLRSGGMLYFATPIGRVQRIEFDAHRVFSLPFLLNMMAGRYRIEKFAYVDDGGELHVNVDPAQPVVAESFNLQFGCGIFALHKP
jgi:hypothetical protein